MLLCTNCYIFCVALKAAAAAALRGPHVSTYASSQKKYYSEIFLINNCQCQNKVKKPYCTTLKFGHMDQLYNNLTPNHG
jgi:hypothetical protein